MVKKVRWSVNTELLFSFIIFSPGTVSQLTPLRWGYKPLESSQPPIFHPPPVSLTCLTPTVDSPTVFILCVLVPVRHLGGGRNLAFVVGQTEVWELVLPVVVWSWASPLIWGSFYFCICKKRAKTSSPARWCTDQRQSVRSTHPSPGR